MSILFDLDGRGPSGRALLLRGLAVLIVAVGLLAALLLKTSGYFDEKVEVTAMLQQLGDGVPDRSDVKFRGMLVGTVAGVTPAADGEPNRVLLNLDPTAISGIPETVTARVVPSNVFAVSSVQLVDNGPAPSLQPNAEIPQDTSLSTVQLQSALTKLRQIIAATARIGSQNVVGILATVAQATDRRGSRFVEAGAQLDRITKQFDSLLTSDGGTPTLTMLADSVHGLNTSAPELLDALHHAVLPMRTLADQSGQLTALLTAGASTLGSVDGALDRRTDEISGVIQKLDPVLDVVADGSPTFSPIMLRMKNLSDKWFAEVWNTNTPRGMGRFQFRLTPHMIYTKKDCPRYGELVAPSCSTGPTDTPPEALPPSLDLRNYPEITGADLLGSLPPGVKDMIERSLQGLPTGAESLLGPLLADGPLPAGVAPGGTPLPGLPAALIPAAPVPANAPAGGGR
ncbi:MlaD family protein [Skermania piniformis]|uniref:MCE family protein n=1 Tax=Skermania pinensis TaxID=39122 RepID=A0ABX8SBY2_9ACTN|nr:MCE family protein [Skermania piniformis]QXQ15369.1 MCE family protein [Skermania piniformis]